MGQLIEKAALLLQGQLLRRQIPSKEQQVATTGLGNAAPLQLQQLLTHAVSALTIPAAEPLQRMLSCLDRHRNATATSDRLKQLLQPAADQQNRHAVGPQIGGGLIPPAHLTTWFDNHHRLGGSIKRHLQQAERLAQLSQRGLVTHPGCEAWSPSSGLSVAAKLQLPSGYFSATM